MLSYLYALLEALNISVATFLVAVATVCLPPVLALLVYEQQVAKQQANVPVGCRRLGLNVSSNLSNEFDPRFAEGFPASAEESADMFWRVKSLWVYPIKGCKGVELGRTDCFTQGMSFDGSYTFAKKTADGSYVAITEADAPKLAKVSLDAWQVDQSVDSYDPKHEDALCNGVLIASFPTTLKGLMGAVAGVGASLKGESPMQTFRIPFEPSATQIAASGFTDGKIALAKGVVTGLNMSSIVPADLKKFLGVSDLALFRVDNKYLRDAAAAGPMDAYPLHVINLATVREVEAEMKSGKKLSARHFGANIIVTGPEPSDELTWKKIKIGWYEFNLVPRTDGKMAAIGEKGLPNVSCFGMQMAPADDMCQFKVGDEIAVLERS